MPSILRRNLYGRSHATKASEIEYAVESSQIARRDNYTYDSRRRWAAAG